MTGTQALLISGQISLPVSVSAVAAAAGIKVIDYATFRAQFENSLDDICRMVSYAGFSMLADGRMVAVLNSQLCYAPRRKWTLQILSRTVRSSKSIVWVASSFINAIFLVR